MATSTSIARCLAHALHVNVSFVPPGPRPFNNGTSASTETPASPRAHIAGPTVAAAAALLPEPEPELRSFQRRTPHPAQQEDGVVRQRRNGWLRTFATRSCAADPAWRAGYRINAVFIRTPSNHSTSATSSALVAQIETNSWPRQCVTQTAMCSELIEVFFTRSCGEFAVRKLRPPPSYSTT